MYKTNITSKRRKNKEAESSVPEELEVNQISQVHASIQAYRQVNNQKQLSIPTRIMPWGWGYISSFTIVRVVKFNPRYEDLDKDVQLFTNEWERLVQFNDVGYFVELGRNHTVHKINCVDPKIMLPKYQYDMYQKEKHATSGHDYTLTVFPMDGIINIPLVTTYEELELVRSVL